MQQLEFWFFDKYDSEEDKTKNCGDISMSGRGVIKPTCTGKGSGHVQLRVQAMLSTDSTGIQDFK